MAAAWCRLLPVAVLLMSLLGSAVAPGGAVSRPRPQRPRPKKPKVEPIDTTPPAADIDIQQVGIWRHWQKSSTLYMLWFEVFLLLLWCHSPLLLPHNLTEIFSVFWWKDWKVQVQQNKYSVYFCWRMKALCDECRTANKSQWPYVLLCLCGKIK